MSTWLSRIAPGGQPTSSGDYVSRHGTICRSMNARGPPLRPSQIVRPKQTPSGRTKGSSRHHSPRSHPLRARLVPATPDSSTRRLLPILQLVTGPPSAQLHDPPTPLSRTPALGLLHHQPTSRLYLPADHRTRPRQPVESRPISPRTFLPQHEPPLGLDQQRIGRTVARRFFLRPTVHRLAARSLIASTLVLSPLRPPHPPQQELTWQGRLQMSPPKPAKAHVLVLVRRSPDRLRQQRQHNSHSRARRGRALYRDVSLSPTRREA